MTPLEAAKEAIRLRSLYDNNWHPMGGHGDPVRGPGFDLDRHLRNHAVDIATALIEAEEKVERMRERCRDLEMICLTWGMSDDDGNPWGRRVTDGKIILSLFDKDEEDGEIELESDPRTGLPILTDEARAALTALAGDPK